MVTEEKKQPQKPADEKPVFRFDVGPGFDQGHLYDDTQPDRTVRPKHT